MMDEYWIADQRQEAARWARDLLRRPFVIFDGETTGLEAQDEFVQIGLIDHTGRVLLDTLIRAEQPITPRAAGIHGLMAVHLVKAQRFPDLYPQLAALLRDQHVVAYNAEFDARILQQACRRYNLPPVQAAAWDCAMKRYAQFYGTWDWNHRSFRWQSLIGACQTEQVEVLDAHSAVGDCRMTLRLIEKMAGAAAGE